MLERGREAHGSTGEEMAQPRPHPNVTTQRQRQLPTGVRERARPATRHTERTEVEAVPGGGRGTPDEGNGETDPNRDSLPGERQVRPGPTPQQNGEN